MRPIHLHLIAAIDQRRAIGAQGQLPWVMPKDMAYFKRQTLGHPVIMGYKTAQSLPFALPKRTNVVLSRHHATPPHDGQLMAKSWDEAQHLLQSVHHDPSLSSPLDVWVIGGAEIYKLFLPLAKSVHLTRIDTTAQNADAFFPEMNEGTFMATVVEVIEPDERHAHRARIIRYDRLD